MQAAIEAASGRWPELLGALAHLSADQLTDKHQPCPINIGPTAPRLAMARTGLAPDPEQEAHGGH